MSDAPLKRFMPCVQITHHELSGHSGEPTVVMAEHPDGEYVRFSDVVDASTSALKQEAATLYAAELLAAHTPEPWQVGFKDGSGEGYIVSSESEAVVVRGGVDDWGVNHGAFDPANARRIVACVNACAGLSTENLENNRGLLWLANEYSAATKQRDALLAALEYMVANIGQPECLETKAGFDAARAAIAAAGGSQ